MNIRREKGQTSTLSLIVLVLIVMAIGLIAVVTQINRSNYQEAAAGAVTSTSTREATTTATTTAARPAAVSSVARKTTGAQPSSGSNITVIIPPRGQGSTGNTNQAAVASAPAAPRYRLCTANDLTGTASWQGSGGSLAGTLNITDSAKSSCSLPHDDYLQILSGGQVLSVGQLTNPDARGYSDLTPGDTVAMPFLWSNWCGGALAYQAYVRLILPDNGGYIRVPLIDSGGNPQSNAPRCDAPGTYSSVRIWRY